MLKQSEISVIKSFAQSQLDSFSNSVIYAIVENNIITWQLSSNGFGLEAFQEGNTLDHCFIKMALQKKMTVTETISESIFGHMIKITSVPIEDNEQVCSSVFLTITPIVHPMQEAFKLFAPHITNLFPSGAFLYISDRHKILHRQGCDKFDIKRVQSGDVLEEKHVLDVLITGKSAFYDSDSPGASFRIYIAPYYDEKTNEIIGVFSVIRPKQTELDLKNMSTNLEHNLSDVASAIQQLAASATLINANEQELNANIGEIILISDQIHEISNLIKSIADKTNMLGLNAAIEAARAGSAGKGFSVVAQEIKNLSDQSKNTVPKIIKLTDNIKAKVTESKNMSQSSLLSSQEQAAATEEIIATIEEIQAMSEELANISKNV